MEGRKIRLPREFATYIQTAQSCDKKQPHNVRLTKPKRGKAGDSGHLMAALGGIPLGEQYGEHRSRIGVVEKGEKVQWRQQGQGGGAKHQV